MTDQDHFQEIVSHRIFAIDHDMAPLSEDGKAIISLIDDEKAGETFVALAYLPDYDGEGGTFGKCSAETVKALRELIAEGSDHVAYLVHGYVTHKLEL